MQPNVYPRLILKSLTASASLIKQVLNKGRTAVEWETVTVKIEPITPEIGAYVSIRAEDAITNGMPDQILAALNQYNVLVFPQVNMSDDTLAQLSAAMGDPYAPAATADGSEASAKGIYRIALDKDDKNQLDYVKGNDYWHMDGTVYNVPNKGTLLKCESPAKEGGDTEFANLFAAYDALPEGKKEQIAGLRVVHCLASVGRKMYANPTPEDFARWDAVFPPREHPLVWKQKDGRTSLLIGSTADHIVGMDSDESTALLNELLDWCTSDRFTYRHHWHKGDLVIFNNPGLLHRSLPYNEAAGRLMHRTTIKGHEAIQ
jgi:alpha-ketoglutarate-dependent taurine dioxygenase